MLTLSRLFISLFGICRCWCFFIFKPFDGLWNCPVVRDRDIGSVLCSGKSIKLLSSLEILFGWFSLMMTLHSYIHISKYYTILRSHHQSLGLCSVHSVQCACYCSLPFPILIRHQRICVTDLEEMIVRSASTDQRAFWRAILLFTSFDTWTYFSC